LRRFGEIGATRAFLQIHDLGDLDHLDMIAAGAAPLLPTDRRGTHPGFGPGAGRATRGASVVEVPFCQDGAMQPGEPRITLSVGFIESRGWRIARAVSIGVVFVCLCGMLGGILGAMFSALGSGDAAPAVVSGFAFTALGLAVAWVAGFVAYLVRAGAWLSGTRLIVRNLTMRTVDLAAARSVALGTRTESREVATGSAGRPERIPMLTVSDGAGTVRLRLRSREGALLPPAEMRALADALATARCPGAPEAAAWLRAIAADPRSLFS
jgi:hypothetical protein